MEKKQQQPADQKEPGNTVVCKNCLKTIWSDAINIHEIKCNQSILRKKSSSISKKEQEEYESFELQCEMCGMSIKMKDYEHHSMVCEAEFQNCPFCNERFPCDIMKDHYEYCEVRKSLESPQKKAIQKHKQQSKAQNKKSGKGALAQNNKEKLEKKLSSRKSLEQKKSSWEQKEQMQDLEKLIKEIELIAQKSELKKKNKGLTEEEIFEIPESTFIAKKQSNGKLICEECPICFVDFDETSIIRMRCLHIFHPDCLRPWLKTNAYCPSCKKSYYPDKKEEEYKYMEQME